MFTIIAIILFIQINQLKTIFLSDSQLKTRQIQELDAGISFQNKKRQFITLARDSIIMKYNNKITYEEAYDIAEFNLYISEKYQLDPILLLAIQRQESIFNKNAVSHVGAIGLNQIYPMTGRILCDAMDIEYSPSILYDTKINTELAAKYLTYLRAEYHKLDYILIGYNAGPKWIHYHKLKKYELPEETQEYVIAVKEFYRQFDKYLSLYLPSSKMKIEHDTIDFYIETEETIPEN
jgi:soluble lytic murein transglycosylase-like protein